MSRTYVAIDLETTGLDPEKDRITEVGAVRFSGDGDVLGTFQSLVNPGRDIPYFVETLTGVTNEAVREAPRLASIAPDLVRFAASDPVVGQNIGFDLAFLRREGVTLPGEGIDTARLSRILLPGRRPRGLVDLARELEVEAGEHHRALSDAQTAADIFVALRRRALALPEGQRTQLARLLSMESMALAEAVGGDGWAAMPVAERNLPRLKAPPPLVALAKREPPIAISPAEVARVFGAARDVLPGFEERPQQGDMAETVRDALANGGHWLIEAGTGVGKSLAYLVPAALHALKNGERVVVSTNTINLQEQLYAHDIPALRQMLVRAGVIAAEGDLRATVLKGRSNYLCLRRWMAGYGAAMADPDFARLGSEVLLWLPETATGDRSELNLDPVAWQTWQRFSAQDADCLARPNAFVKDGTCFLLRARKAAESAHIVIVNHALLLADIASGGSALPPFEHVVVDEAHNLEDQATQQFGGSVSRRVVQEALDGLHRRASRDQREGGVVTLLKAFPEGALHNAGVGLETAVAEVAKRATPAFEAIGRLVPRRGDEERVLISRGVRNSAEWEAVEAAWGELDKSLLAVSGTAELARRIVKETASSEDPDALAGEIETAARKVEEVRDLFGLLVNSTDSNRIVWAGRERDGGGTLNSAPLDVGPTLQEHLFAKRRTVIATSATLGAGGNMAFTARRLGLDEAETLQLGSPYDYERSTLLAAFTDIPEPADPGYTAAVARAVVGLTQASEGRALVLFTSHASLRQVAELAREPLREAGIALLAQGIDGSPRQLTENLATSPKTVVLGTASFWEGVDIRGDALSMLIIARLPFGVPTDPVFKARSEQYEDPFGQYSLPAAILRFRQGFGRLIRDRTDRGVVAVLDRRIYDKRYGQQFVDALPPCTRLRADTGTVAERAREWLVR